MPQVQSLVAAIWVPFMQFMICVQKQGFPWADMGSLRIQATTQVRPEPLTLVATCDEADACDGSERSPTAHNKDATCDAHPT